MKYQKYSKLFTSNLPKQKSALLDNQQLAKLHRASEIALGVIGALGIISLAVMAPNLLQILDRFIYKKDFKKISSNEKQKRTLRTFYYLKQKGFIKLKPDKEDYKIFITNLGRKKLQKLNLAFVSVTRPRKWNGRWWQVAADIPTKKYRQGADMFRRKLKQMGFYSLQRTLWLYPFDPRKEIEFISREFNIANFVTVMEIYRLDVQDEKLITKHFKNLGIL